MKDTATYPHVSVIIPALNEAENLYHVLPDVSIMATEVILVDGHSTDNTIEMAERLFPDIKVVRQTGKGKGDALRCGFAASTGDIVVMMDADGSTDPREIPQFVNTLLAGADVARGSRFIGQGGSADFTSLRRLGNCGLSWIASQLFRAHFTDLCYGYIAFRKECLDYFDVDGVGFTIDALINLRAHKAKFKIVEVPSYEYPRLHGSSHLHPFRDGWRLLSMIVREWVNGDSVIKTPESHPQSQLGGEVWVAPVAEQLGAAQ